MGSEIDRRGFLAQMTAAGGIVFSDRGLQQGTLLEREIPGTGERLPVVGLGSTKAVLQIPEFGSDPIVRVLEALVRQGGRVVDSSPRTESIDTAFGEAFAGTGLRDALFIAAKINTTEPERAVVQMQQNQRTFGRQTLDLIQIESLRGLTDHWPTLRAWKDNGEARYIGITTSSYEGYDQVERFMRRERPDFVHVNYSVVERRAEERLLPLALESGIAVLTNRPFMNGAYFGLVNDRPLPGWAPDFECRSWAQFSVKYVVAHPAVTCCLTETVNPSHVVDNIMGGVGPMPDETHKRQMRAIIDGMV